MVRRLLVALLCFSCGFSLLLNSQASVAQTDTDQKPPAKVPAVVPPKTPALVPPKTPALVPPKSPADAVEKTPAVVAPQTPDPVPSKTPAVVAPKTPVVVTPKSSASPSSKVDPIAVQTADDKILSEHLLPASTKFWLSIPDADKLQTQFELTQIGLLAKDPAIKPFFDSLRDQAKELFNDQNERLGLEIDDIQGVQSGEICVAGVLPELDGKQPAKGAHGLILLVDVSDTEKEARELQKKINKLLVERGAVQKDFPINGVLVTKSTIEKNNKRRLRQNQSNFQAVVNGWMLICDNENIFRDVLRRLSAPKKIQKIETLSAQASFSTIMEQTDLEENESHIRWFIDPFGYIQLAQAIQDEERATRPPRDDWAKIMKNQGFSAFQGIGGNVSLATSEHEILHRSYTYAPRTHKTANGKQIFELFDFSGNDSPLAPANWVPADCSAYIVANWNMTKALASIGGLYDAFLEEEDAFKRMLNDFKVDPDMQLDINKLVGLINNRFTVVSATVRPITETSERVVIGFPIKGEPEFVFDSLKRATRGNVIVLGGIKVIEVDSAEEEFSDEPDEFQLPGEEIEEDEEEKRPFELFQKRYFAVHKGTLLVANNKDYLKKLLSQKVSKLSEAEDYIQIKESLAKLTDIKKTNWRQFGRTDRTLEANYEMLRRGEMGKSQTVLARVVNQIFAKRAAELAAAEGKEVDEKAVRNQKLDGSKLPENYAKSIAPYFGPMGWVMETEKDGWRITGCVLKKKAMTEVVQKVGDDDKNASQQR